MRKQEELKKEVESKKEQIDDLERAKIDRDQKIVILENELAKEKDKVS